MDTEKIKRVIIGLLVINSWMINVLGRTPPELEPKKPASKTPLGDGLLGLDGQVSLLSAVWNQFFVQTQTPIKLKPPERVPPEEQKGCKEKYTIFIDLNRQRAQQQVRFFVPNEQGDGYDMNHSSSFILPYAPIFFSGKKKYNYPGKSGNKFGEDKSDVLEHDGNIVVSVAFPETEAREEAAKKYPILPGSRVYESIVIYREYLETEERRWFLFWGHVLGIIDLLAELNGNGIFLPFVKLQTYIPDYVRNDPEKINWVIRKLDQIGQNDENNFSALASQGSKGRVAGVGGRSGLPGWFKRDREETTSLTTLCRSILDPKDFHITHHIFLSEKETEILEKAFVDARVINAIGFKAKDDFAMLVHVLNELDGKCSGAGLCMKFLRECLNEEFRKTFEDLDSREKAAKKAADDAAAKKAADDAAAKKAADDAAAKKAADDAAAKAAAAKATAKVLPAPQFGGFPKKETVDVPAKMPSKVLSPKKETVDVPAKTPSKVLSPKKGTAKNVPAKKKKEELLPKKGTAKNVPAKKKKEELLPKKGTAKNVPAKKKKEELSSKKGTAKNNKRASARRRSRSR